MKCKLCLKEEKNLIEGLCRKCWSRYFQIEFPKKSGRDKVFLKVFKNGKVFNNRRGNTL